MALTFTKDGDIAHLRLNRPKQRNAMNLEMLVGLEDAFAEIETDPEIKVVLLSGEGPSFCAGSDLTELGVILQLYTVRLKIVSRDFFLIE